MNSSPTAELASFDETKAQALELRDGIEKTLPSDAVKEVSDKDNLIPCDADTGQYDGTRTIGVADAFDRPAWIDSVASTFDAKDGWKVVRKVAADGSSDAISGLALASEDGYYVRIDEFGDGGQGTPVIILSASGPCSTL